MRHMCAIGVIALAVLAASAAPSRAAGSSDTAAVSVSATFASRTSLRVSTQTLEFDVQEPGREAVATVEFAAGARTHQGAQVVLTVQPARALDGPGGAADVEHALRFDGDGEGVQSGVLTPAGTAVAGRWQGSGMRKGRVRFALRAGIPGRYSVPVEFVLTAP